MSADTADSTTTERPRHDPPLGVLDIVRDREDDDPNDAVVVNTPPVAAEDWAARDGVSVADDNPEYDPEADVIVVAFRGELAETRPDFTDTNDALPLAEADGVDTYAFPPGRLRRVASICPDAPGEHSRKEEGDTDVEPADTEPTLRDDLDAIAEAVRELNVDAVAVDTFREAVVVEKLGVEYTVAPDGTVDDDDRVAEALEAAAAEVVPE